MKLLLDENLSRRLIPFLLEAYPDSTQVVLCGMESSSDLELCAFALANNEPPRVSWRPLGLSQTTFAG